jgi:chitodextrinase
MKVALELPAGATTVAGTFATDVSALASVITAPPAGAGADSVTVPVDVAPLGTSVGESVNDAAVEPEGRTLRTAVTVTPAEFAEMAAKSYAATGWLVATNEAVFVPAATVTLEGTVTTDVLLLVMDTAVPPDGAFDASVTVPVAVSPALTVLGVIEIA